MKRLFTPTVLFLATVLMLCLQPAAANQISLKLDTLVTGDTPNGAPPWLKADFTWTPGSSTGTLAMESLLIGSQFIADQPVTGWAFNFATAITAAAFQSGNDADSVSITPFTVPPATLLGGYNLGFGWANPPSSRFASGDTATYALTFADPLGTNPIVANGEGWLSYAHVQGIAPAGSARVATDDISTPDPTSVPTPATLGLFGLSLLLIGLFLSRRRRYH